jgi:dihydroorotase
MFEAYHQGKISIEKIVEKMCHNPAKIFKVEKRYQRRLLCRFSYRKFSFALSVNKENILLNGWSPFEGFTFQI